MRLSGTNIDHTQRFNRRVVLEVVRLHGPLSRAEIARLTGLSAQTVTNIIDQFKPAELLIEKPRRTGGRGQPPIDLVVNPMAAYSFGISFDHRQVIVILLNLGGAVIDQIELPLTYPSPVVVLPLIEAAVNELMSRSKISKERIWGAGVVMPAVIAAGSPTVLGPSAMTEWLGYPLVDRLGERLGIPIFVDNDATAGAIGELLFGAGRQLMDFVYLHLGIGVGGGIITSGRPYRGAFGMSGELGHMISVPAGRPCPCGNRGCLERYVSLSAAHAALTGEAEDFQPFDFSILERALEQRVPALLAWMEEAANRLRDAVITLENVFDPQTVVLGGPIPEALLDGLVTRMGPLPASVSSHHRNGGQRLVKAETGLDTRVLGAASLAIFNSMTPDFSVLMKEDRHEIGTAGPRTRVMPDSRPSEEANGPVQA